jgi:alpha-tubulin suppressor-like RCC1 family protein
MSVRVQRLGLILTCAWSLLAVGCATGSSSKMGATQVRTPGFELPPVAEKVTAGAFHSCALMGDGSVRCWGISEEDDEAGAWAFGQTEAPDERMQEIAAGGFHTCGIEQTTGRVTCWGRNDVGQSQPPPGRFESVVAGQFHTCGLRDSGRVTCWGLGSGGVDDARRLQTGGDGAETLGQTPRRFRAFSMSQTVGLIKEYGPISEAERKAMQVASSVRSEAGRYMSAAESWGVPTLLGERARLGRAVDAHQASPPAGKFVKLAAGRATTCGIEADGRTVCWGDVPQAWDGSEVRLEDVAIGHGGICGATERGSVKCWGVPEFDQWDFIRERDIQSVSMGYHHLCVGAGDGAVRCAGVMNGWFGVEAPDGEEQTSGMASGAYHVCGVGMFGRVSCGGLGSGDRTPSKGDVGQAVAPEIRRFDRIEVGARQTCVQSPRREGERVAAFQCRGGNQAAMQAFRERFVGGVWEVDESDQEWMTGAVHAGGRRTCVELSTATLTPRGVVCWDNRQPGEERKTSLIVEELGTDPGSDSRDEMSEWRGFAIGGAHRCHRFEDNYGRSDVVCRGLGSKSGVWEGVGDASQAVEWKHGLWKWTEMVLGERHSCAYWEASAACWGDVSVSRFSPNLLEEREGKPSVRDGLAQGPHHGCWLQGGRAVCDGMGTERGIDEGRYDFDQASPPRVSLVSLTAGRRYTCGIRAENRRVECWGDNSRGQLEAPDRKFASITAVTLPPDADGYGWTCGVTLDHEVVCWGAEPDQLEIRERDEMGERPALAGLGSASAVAAGARHTCLMDGSGRVGCWGDARGGATAAPRMTRFQKVVAGDGYGCGIREDATLQCWGRDMPKRTAALLRRDGARAGVSRLQGHAPAGRFRDVAAGPSHACAAHLDGTVDCWGASEDGASEAPEEGGFVEVAAGGAFSCGLKGDGRLRCWGGVPFGPSVKQQFETIAAGRGRLCGVTEKSEGVVCIGFESGGPPSTGVFKSVSLGRHHGCALDSQGNIDCWTAKRGDGAQDGERDRMLRFGQADPPEGDFVAVSAGGHHTCAVRQSGGATCWGLGSELKTQEAAADFNQSVVGE